MNFNQGSIGFTNKQDAPPDPPFSVAGANNGLSLDPETGTIAQLGQSYAGGGTAAALLNDRAIPGAFTISIPDGKLGIGKDTGAFLPTSDQNFMVLSDEWTNEIRAAAAFFRSMVTPSSNDILIDSIIPGSFSCHLVLADGSFIGGEGSVIAAIKGNLVTQGANLDPAFKTTLQLNAIDGGWLPIGAQNIRRVAIIRAQRPDTTGGPTGTVDEVIGFLIESLDSVAGLGDPDRYGILQEGDDQNVFGGRVLIRTDALENDVFALQIGTRSTLNRVLFKTTGEFALTMANGTGGPTANVTLGATLAGGLQVSNVSGQPLATFDNAGAEVKTITDSTFSFSVVSQSGANAFRVYADNAGNIILNGAGNNLIMRVAGNTIGFYDPTGYKQVVGDVEVETLGAGVIVKSPNGNRWRLTVSNAGVVGATAV